MTTLQKAGVAVGILVSLGTLSNTIGTVYVGFYKLSDVERKQIAIDTRQQANILEQAQQDARISELEKDAAATKEHLQLLRVQGANDRELLVRIDERLRQVQRALNIPTNER